MSLIVCKINNSFIDSYHIVYTTASPRNVILAAPNSTTLLLHWEPPEEDPRDGMILQYSIVCRFGDGDSLPPRNSPASSQSLGITDLHPFTNYNCCVSAQRTNGNSPESCISETTPEDGMINNVKHLKLSSIISLSLISIHLQKGCFILEVVG